MAVGSGMSVASLTPIKMRNVHSDHTPVNIARNIFLILLMLQICIMQCVESI